VDPTPAMVFGTIFHTAVLEPEKLVIAPDVNLRTNAGKAEMAAFRDGIKPGQVVATQGQADIASAMRNSIMHHRFAAALLEAPGDIELSVTFNEPTYGIPCKIRPDKINHDDLIIIDLKSTVDASEEKFAKAIYNFGYDISGTFYNLGAMQAFKKNYEFIIIAVEKDPPFGVNVFRLTEKHFEIGYGKIDSILDQLHRCIDTDNWPCYPQKILNPEIPAWEFKKYYKH